jgi:hypothetical protein
MLAALAAAAMALLLADVALLDADDALLDAEEALLEAADAEEAAADADAVAAAFRELFSAFCAFSSLIMLVCHVRCACMAASKATGSPPYLSGGLVPGGVDTATVILSFLIYNLRWIVM